MHNSKHSCCNYLTLGWTTTEGEAALRESYGESEPEFRQRPAASLPMGRICESSDYIEALIYLVSNANAMMTGSTFRMTAGKYYGISAFYNRRIYK